MKKNKIIKYRHTHCMTLKEWKEFVDNFNKLRGNSSFYIFNIQYSIKEYLLKYEYSFMDLMLDAFEWEKSPQGEDYWFDMIHKK